MNKFNVLYKGRKIYMDLTLEECSEVLQDLSERYYSDKDIDINLIQLEKI